MSSKSRGGRPHVTANPEVVSILVESFHSGMTVREACWQSGISHEAYYNRIRSDEKFADTMAKAQEVPIINARRVVIEAINQGDISAAKWWLERKAPDEFGRNMPLKLHVEQPSRNPFMEMSEEEILHLRGQLQSALS